MEKESEKRFEALMDKLFRTPQRSKTMNLPSPITRTSEFQLTRGKKRPNTSSELALIDPKTRSSAVGELQNSSGSSGSVQAPSCRPWDRDDLYRRLATFKSMTWFAKPQAVSAINCARRGWINIDMDIIACESCGARLLFSTPSSWTQQQVEKAALVFSLKLESGHKLLCPWVDNNCDESLAQFPPKPSAVLVEDYKKRFSALLQLSALPLVSSTTIDCLRSPQLQEFLDGFSDLENNSHGTSGRSLVYEQQSTSPNSYYQAQKLISLCGWEPHSLPYIVDKGQEHQFTKNVHLANQSCPASNGLELGVIHSPFFDRNKEAYDESQVSALSDPNSVVFYCSLCSATVGLWTFSLVPRPMEFLRLVGYTEVDGNDKTDCGKPEDENDDSNVQGGKTNFTAPTSLHEKTSLNLTIAGGPPPAKQNYRAKISLPLVGRSLRARFFAAPSMGKDHNLSLSEADITGQGTDQICEQDSIMGNSVGDVQVVDSCKDDKLEANGSMEKSSREPVGEHIGPSTKDNITMDVNDKDGETNAARVVETANDKQGDRQHDNVTGSRVQLVTNNIDSGGLGKSTSQASLPKPLEFDPFKQHRIFCPWIVPTAESPPGWQRTLSALQRQKELAHPLPDNAPLVEVDNPIALVKKLLNSPPTKRAKHAHASNA